MRSRIVLALFALTIVGCGDDSPLPPGPQGPMDAAGTVTALGGLYEAQSLAGFTALLSDDFVFVRNVRDPETGAMQWNTEEELALHARMFDPEGISATDSPLATDLWLQTVSITLTPMIAFAERTDLYTAANPQGALDQNRWIARGATYATDAFFSLRGETDYQVLGRAYFVVLEDRTKQVGDSGKFLLYRWEDLGLRESAKSAAVEPSTWSDLKSVYRRGRVAPPEAGGFIDRLAESYRTRDLTLFSSLLVGEYRFVFDQPNPKTGEMDWGISEERSLHRRMFTPTDRPPGEEPLPADLVVQNIQITLTPVTSFVERRDLYTTANPPGPLYPYKWIARGAIFGTDVLFNLAGGTDYLVVGRANFVVLEDRYLQSSDPRKFLLYCWEDLGLQAAGRGVGTNGVEAASWSSMKSLYRFPPYGVPSDPASLIQTLANAYQRRDADDFVELLSPDFLFILAEPDPDTGETRWNAITEARIHRRMFEPQNIPPGDPPLPADYWLQEITVSLAAHGEFAERPDLYTTADPPGPLDPSRWTASGAVYSADVFFQLQGEVDYQITGGAYFIVVEDRTKPIGDPGRLQLYRWKDLGNVGDLATQASNWSDVKGLYK